MPRLIATALLSLIMTGAQAEEPAGQRLYVSGQGATVLIANGSVEVPATAFACAGCHGADARGGREGATSFPALINGTSLRFDRASLDAAVIDGIGPDGRKLAAAMPRYRIDPANLEALYTYLSTLATTQRVGISPGTLRIALPTDPALRDGFKAAIENANRQGGAWGRTFELSDDPETALITGDEALKQVARSELKTLAEAVVTEMRRRTVSEIAVAGSDPDFTDALVRSGAVIDPDAAMQVERLPTGAELRDRSGRTRPVSFTPPHTPADQNRSPAYLAARAISRAALSCGRNITRGCIILWVSENDP